LACSSRRPDEIDRAVAAMVRERTRALIVMPGSVFFPERQRLVEAAARHRLPTAYAQREYVDAGGLMAYGSSLSDLFARAAPFVDKILKGAKPAELPVEQPTKFELVINRKTAKALGLTIPQSLLLRADAARLPHAAGTSRTGASPPTRRSTAWLPTMRPAVVARPTTRCRRWCTRRRPRGARESRPMRSDAKRED
jgi:hypothetical protein